MDWIYFANSSCKVGETIYYNVSLPSDEKPRIQDDLIKMKFLSSLVQRKRSSRYDETRVNKF